MGELLPKTKEIDRYTTELNRFCTGKTLDLNTIDRLLFLEGILLFNHPGIYDHSNLRFFLKVTKETCSERRSERDYDPPDPPTYFDQVVWPYYQNNLMKNVFLLTHYRWY